MSILSILQDAISSVGIKEVARRAELSASTVSRIRSGQVNPSLDVAERISKVLGLQIEIHNRTPVRQVPRLESTVLILIRLKSELASLGVTNVIIFGSVARLEDEIGSDIDLYLEYAGGRPKAQKMLKAEGVINEALAPYKTDIVDQFSLEKKPRLKQQVFKDGVRVF